jgi:fucose permease
MALLSDIHGDHRAQAYAGQGIFAYAFGFAAPLLAGAFIWLGLGWRTAVLVGPAIGVLVAVYFRGLSIVEPHARAHHAEQRLPPAFWAYWTLVVAVCGLEYAVLFWAPTFLERVAGLAPASAATAAAAFPLGMLLGRIALGDAVRRVAPRRLLVGALALSVVGFLLYWAVSMPAISTLGIFVLGLGIAPLFPLSINFAVGSAAEAADLASVRLAISYGISMLVAPFALGALADAFGLKLAHVAVPGFVLAAYASLIVAEVLEKRSSTGVQARGEARSS